MANRLGIWNQAVAMLPATPIASVDENSLEARECRRLYPNVISEMLEGEHDWSFQNRRVALALHGTNDRDAEWLYAYAVPADMGTPIRIVPDFDSLGFGLPVPLPGEPYSEVWASALVGFAPDYIIENGTLYTNIEGASLEYGINDISESVLTAKVTLAIATELAARLAMPVKKDSRLEEKLAARAELYWQRAIADDRNRQPQRDGAYVSQAMLARSGYLVY